MEQRWARKAAFAEYADALGVDTIQIMATVENQETGLHTVFYTQPDAETGTGVWSAGLKRDESGIFRRVIGPDFQEGMWEQMEKQIEEWLEKKYGPPKEK